MLDFFKSAHEAAAWAGGAAGAFVLAVLLVLKGNAVEAVAAGIRSLLRRLAQRVIGGHGGGAVPADEHVRRAVRNLAQGSGQRTETESIHLKLRAPRPLKVSWREASRYGDRVSQPSLDGVLDEIKVVYDKVRSGSGADRAGRLVVLGPGGSGKSVLLQQLALKMLDDPGPAGSVPVIFNLSSWETGTGLDDWLTAQLLRLRYAPGLGEEMARTIVTSRLVLPLLDGFDEVGAAGRAELLDLLNDDVGRQLVLASRREEYLETVQGQGGSNGTVLADASVIELTGLPLGEATDYLRGLPRSRARHDGGAEPAWEPVARELLLEQKTAAARRLAEVFEKPLMVAIARDVYRYEDPARLLGDAKSASVEEIENSLLDDFIPAIYDGNAEHPSRWGEDRALRAFRYLASCLEPSGGDGSRRRDIAWWEIGTAGMTARKRSVLTGLAGGLVMAFTYGIVSLTAVYIAGYRVGRISPAQALAEYGELITAVLGFGFAHWLAIRYKGRLLEPSRASTRFFGRPGGRESSAGSSRFTRSLTRRRPSGPLGCWPPTAGSRSWAAWPSPSWPGPSRGSSMG